MAEVKISKAIRIKIDAHQSRWHKFRKCEVKAIFLNRFVLIRYLPDTISRNGNRNYAPAFTELTDLNKRSQYNRFSTCVGTTYQRFGKETIAWAEQLIEGYIKKERADVKAGK